ncbi:MAG: hypothetical protein A2131_02190 [Candidatus Sungbacteria bacterium GWC2_49_10]|uniref:UDP-N-acetylglucosamine 2-epimerase domain-containing protein n=2 Tax=Parcubacteria group TaxID=1794811 RepID=A0A1G2K253_9BACT|nr:MAG: hypothetical protein UY60_C0002G0018 [Parcubacteria group bacterium GW2011_GWB1_50_9]OGZ93465.1 MAG: hypothetical protein A2131_02190 [Candidatus Sungbacteria bacterium GWC2_49_10]
MKKIFITVNDGSIARNILRSFVLEKIIQHSDVHVGLVTHADKEEFYRTEFGSDRISVFGILGRPLSFFERVLSYCIRNGLWTETILMDQRTHMEGRYVAFAAKRTFIYLFGKSKWFHAFVRRLFLLRAPSRAMEELFSREKPDLLFSTDVQIELDFDATIAAHKNNVPVVGMVRSWDNPTSRGGLVPYIHVVLLVWSPYIAEKMEYVQQYPRERIRLVGIPHFDWYVKDIIVPREEFFRKLGIDPKKKMILFAGIGDFHAPHEIEVLEIIARKLREGMIEDAKEVVLVFRPHPAFRFDENSVKRLGNVVFDSGISSYSGKDRSSWEMEQEQVVHLANSLAHCDVLVTTASTMTVDAAAFDKPIVCVAFDGKSQEPHWRSVKRYYHDYSHYIALSRTKGFAIAYTRESLITYINNYLDNPNLDAEGRERIRQEFIWKLDGHSADRVAHAALMFSRN